MNWQPIETAPKDEWILLYQYQPGYSPELGCEISMRSHDDKFWIGAMDNPTHWAPLNPPKVTN